MEDLKTACERYAYQSPLYQNLPLTLKGAYKFSDFLTREEFHRTEGYQEVMKPIGVDDEMLIPLDGGNDGKIPRKDDQVAYYVLYHPWQSLTERDRLILNLLQPHLTQAYQTAQCFQQLQQQLVQLRQSLDRSGVIFLDSFGQVQLMTSQAARWLQSYFPSNNSSSQLPEQMHSWVEHQVDQLNAVYNLPAPCVPLRFQQGNRQLTIRLIIDQPGEQYLLLLAEEQVLSLLTALELLGLSRREAEVLFWIIQGKGNKAIAVQLSIHVSTVRKHLENIYHKLDVQSRTEAIALALEKSGCLQSPPLI